MKTNAKKRKNNKQPKMAVCHCHAIERCRSCDRPAIPGEGLCYTCLGLDR